MVRRLWPKDLSGFFVYLLLVSTLGPFLFGYHLLTKASARSKSELNTPQDVITCKRKSIFGHTALSSLPHCIQMDSLQIGVVTSIFTLGGLAGALGAGPMAARYGRLKTMRLMTAFFILGPVLTALASNIALMATGRFISGVGAGAAVVVVPIYISEIAPPGRKGFFGAFTQIMINAGIFTAQLLGYFLSRGQLWRIILGVGGLFGLLQIAGLSVAVESPKWMADRGWPVSAKQTLRSIRGRAIDIEEEVTGWGVEDVGERNEEEETLLENHNHVSHGGESGPDTKNIRQHVLGIFDVIRHPEYNRAAIVVVVVMVAQQLCGINSIVMYGVSLLADLLKSNSALLNLAVSALNVFVTTASAPLVDKLGRQACLIGSIAGMGTSSVLLAVGIKNSIPELSAIAVLVFVSSFAFGLGPVPFILSSELVGPEAVGATQSWALAANWISTFLVAQFFPFANAQLGKGNVYFIFAGIAALSLLFVVWFVPETKGKRDADEVWGRQRRRED